jgi:hypothetical protein
MRLSHRWALVITLWSLGCKEDAASSSTTSPASEAAAGTIGSVAAAGQSGPAAAAGSRSTAGAIAATGRAGTSATPSASGAPSPAGSPATDHDADAGPASPTTPPSATSGADLAAFKATGVDKYIGAAKPAKMTAGENGVTTFTFDIADGPRCLRGDAYAMSIRKQDSDNLVIYLQGGGSCSSAVCSATTTASPNIPAAGLTSSTDDSNPVASWNLVYVPYCDGSLHYGDRDHEQESPPRYHHGLRNLSAALDVGVANFPSPKRILLSGSSAGGLGTIYASMLVRLLYPQAELFVWNDSGVGISTPDGSRAKLTRDEWATAQLIPASCSECLASPHSTPVIAWNLQRDPGLHVSFFSSYEDTVIADTFLMIGGPAFKQALLDVTGKVTTAFPERAKRFYIEGQKHTTAGNLTATMVKGTTIGQWLEYMLDADPKWTDTLQ